MISILNLVKFQQTSRIIMRMHFSAVGSHTQTTVYTVHVKVIRASAGDSLIRENVSRDIKELVTLYSSLCNQ